MFKVMFWINKGEMRVINLSPESRWRSAVHEAEFVDVRDSPTFQTANEGWDWITANYPQYAP